ncbi:MAG: chemotaxis protein CheX [Deltaproteobacteria bacterium]|nr:chemotaxis protein CheX [Deltaproteobacteria bacterium]
MNEYMDAAVTGTREMLSMMMGIDDSLNIVDSSTDSVFVSGIITFRHGEINGQVSLQFPEDTGKHLVSLMLGIQTDEVDEESLGDGVGEMVNIVAGQLKTWFQLDGKDFTISLPSIIYGMDHQINVFKRNTVLSRVIDFDDRKFMIVLQFGN